MTRSLRVLFEYPGVGKPNQIISETSVTGNPQALVDAGICEWIASVDRSVVIETTDATPVRETTTTVRKTARTGPRTGPRGSTGGDNAV